MYGYAEISTTEDETYRTRTFSIEILLTIIRPYFGIPSGLFLLYAILASIPVIGFCYYLIIRDPKR